MGKYKPKCFIITEEVCQPKQERKCQPAYEEQCQQLTKKNGKCTTAYKDVPYEDTVCNDEYVQECPQVWEERYGTNVWVPDTKLRQPEKNQLPNCYKIQEGRV